MHNQALHFNSRILEIKALGSVFDFLEKSVSGILDYTDILRAQIVYAVSAYDALLHDLIREGMRDAYLGVRPSTPKFDAEALTVSQHKALVAASVIPAHQSLTQKFM